MPQIVTRLFMICSVLLAFTSPPRAHHWYPIPVRVNCPFTQQCPPGPIPGH